MASIKRIIQNSLIKTDIGKHFIAKAQILKTYRMLLPKEEIKRCEDDPKEKEAVVQKYIQRWPSRVTDDLRSADKIAAFYCSDALRTELLFYRFAHGFLPEEYVCYDFEKLSKKERDAFISAQDCFVCVRKMNDIAEETILNNKGKTYQRFSHYYQREGLYISKTSDYNAFADYVARHPVFVKKAVFEAMGRSVERVDMRNKDPQKEFEEMISKGPHLVEELIIQSSTMAALNASSVNTVRCITFNTQHGVKDPYYFAKIGRAGSFVDNGGAGGILVGIDKETGRLNAEGYDELNRKYEAHPDSKVVFNGYQLPEWEKMKAMCLEISAMLPKVRYIGWDLAHTDNGWVVVEGNGRGQMIGPQTVWKRGIKAEVEAFMSDMDLIVK